VTASGAMIKGSFELQGSEDALELFRPPARVTGQLTAGATKMCLIAVGVIGIEPLLNGVRCQQQRLSPDGGFQGLQIQFPDALTSNQRLDIPQNLSGEKVAKRGFFLRRMARFRRRAVADRRSARKRRPTAEPSHGSDDTHPAVDECALPLHRRE
jgi:hypothetical protein